MLFHALLVCFSIAKISEWLGLSLELGAFIAGLVMSYNEGQSEQMIVTMESIKVQHPLLPEGSSKGSSPC